MVFDVRKCKFYDKEAWVLKGTVILANLNQKSSGKDKETWVVATDDRFEVTVSKGEGSVSRLYRSSTHDSEYFQTKNMCFIFWGTGFCDIIGIPVSCPTYIK